MSFFGFDTTAPQAPDQSRQTYVDEDLAVYTWGEDSYDGLGNALQEVGDDLNDVTFGGGTVGKLSISTINLSAANSRAHD
jgi:DNA topoisomerase 2-associated protein PAT1